MLLAVVAFWPSLLNIGFGVVHAEQQSYLALVPLAALVVVLSTSRRRDLNIHDTQVDWIVASGLAVLIALVDRLLAPRLSTSAELFRVDVLALFLFLGCCTVLCFGTRAAGRNWPAWLCCALAWPLPYHEIGAFLGGTTTTFALMNLGASALVVGFSIRHSNWRAFATVVGGTLGGVIVTVALAGPPLLVLLGPSFMVLSIGLERAWSTHSRARRRTSSPSSRPLWREGVVLTALGVIVSMSSLLTPTTVNRDELSPVNPKFLDTPAVPLGWSAAKNSTIAWVPKYFGRGATWTRWKYQRTAGQRSQPLVVDLLTTSTTEGLDLYAAPNCYLLTTGFHEGTPVDLGHGITASLYFAS